MSVETLRDRFAMAALQGMLAGQHRCDDVARLCYEVADAFIKARGDAAPQPTGDAVLPSYDECASAVEAGTATALQDFIYHNEPAGEAEDAFRRGLARVLAAEKEAAQ